MSLKHSLLYLMINFKNTLLLGHRGARGEALENTLLGFQHIGRLKNHGLAGVELDVQLSADGHLVVFHDEDLARMCGQQSRIAQLTLAEIRRHLQLGHPIITLASIAQTLHEFSVIELEIKTHERTDYTALIQALARDLIDTPLIHLPLVLTSFDTELHVRLQRHQQLKRLPRGLLIRTAEALANATNTALQLGCVQLGVHYPLLSRAIIAHSHRYNLPMSAWTVNDIDAIQQLIDWQVDVIITDFPSQVLGRQ